MPQLADVVSNQEDNGLAAYVTIDRDSAARLGISVGTVDNALYDAFGQRIVSTIFTQSNQYRVIMEADPGYYRSIDSLQSIYVPSASGGQVPLSAIAKVEVQTRPILINHIAQFPATTVSFNLAPKEHRSAPPSPPSRRLSAILACPSASARLFRARRWRFAAI